MEKNAPGPMRRVWSETDRLRYVPLNWHSTGCLVH
jgi:hypothetical protein